MLDFEGMNFLSIIFFMIAFFYSLVGFGGGSSYIAVLSLFGLSYELIPSVALICNLIVVSGGVFYSIRNKHLSLKTIAPFIMLSIPFSFLGGLISIVRDFYLLILGITLLIVALRMFFFRRENYELEAKEIPFYLALFIGAGLGFLSGLVGIGGGIFLSPILYMMKWGNPKKIAGIASGFIFVNSFAGLFGQIQKMNGLDIPSGYIILFGCVFFGGQIGSWLSTERFTYRRIELLTSILILFVSSRLILISFNKFF